MKPNIGGIDRILRIILGIAIIGLGIFTPLSWWGLIGIIPLLTGVIKYCPLYPLIKFSTHKE